MRGSFALSAALTLCQKKEFHGSGACSGSSERLTHKGPSLEIPLVSPHKSLVSFLHWLQFDLPTDFRKPSWVRGRTGAPRGILQSFLGVGAEFCGAEVFYRRGRAWQVPTSWDLV